MTRKRPVLLALYWGVVSLLVLAALGFEALTFFRTFPAGTTGSTVVFIPPGGTVREISRQLGEAGVLRSPRKLRFLARITRKQSNVRPGEYRFETPTPPWTVLRMLLEGKVILHKVTIPEGLSMKEIAATFAEAGLVDRAEFTELLYRRDFLSRLGLPGETFEGFLFPDTYLFARTDESLRMIETMVAHFRNNLRPGDNEWAKAFGFTLLQWITLASIIEKESSLPEERPLVSSVFHNRLKKRMRLQSDPTVIYGIPDFDGNLTRKDLETATPYNTYTSGGLPPGPIANPGADAIAAAVKPAQTDYLYFVADRKGKHVFSETYEDHRKAVARFQLGQEP